MKRPATAVISLLWLSVSGTIAISTFGCSQKQAAMPAVSTDTQLDLNHQHKHFHDQQQRHDHIHDQAVSGGHSHAHRHSHRHPPASNGGLILGLRLKNDLSDGTLKHIRPHLELVWESPDRFRIFFLRQNLRGEFQPWTPPEPPGPLSIQIDRSAGQKIIAVTVPLSPSTERPHEFKFALPEIFSPRPDTDGGKTEGTELAESSGSPPTRLILGPVNIGSARLTVVETVALVRNELDYALQ